MPEGSWIPAKKRRRFSAEFKANAVRLVTSGAADAASVASQLGISERSLSNWVKQAMRAPTRITQTFTDEAELAQLRAEIRRVTMERDILERAATFFSRGGTNRYEFIEREKTRFPVARLCELLRVPRGSLYFWRHKHAGK